MENRFVITYLNFNFYLRRLARRSISAPDSDFGGEGGVYTEFHPSAPILVVNEWTFSKLE